ncbi:enoyl-CoA hydratase/isomerase family protein [bacterium]|nr:MAG: enoyl-CoA hydratase/isomerase family protein [bacterium]
MLIETTLSSRVYTIWLNRPEKKNALNAALVSALKHALLEAISNVDAKIITIRAKGDVFSAGADLEALQQLQDATYEENLADSNHLSELFQLIYESPKPVIAAVHGHAIAGGCGLATVCDITLVQKGAKLGYTETRIGFVPAIVSKFIVEKSGVAFAKDVLLSGRLFEADEAYQKNLITEAIDETRFEERVRFWEDMLIQKTSGQALSSTKKIIQHAAELNFSDFIPVAIETNAKARSSEDCKRGIHAFLNKEQISW